MLYPIRFLALTVFLLFSTAIVNAQWISVPSPGKNHVMITENIGYCMHTYQPNPWSTASQIYKTHNQWGSHYTREAISGSTTDNRYFKDLIFFTDSNWVAVFNLTSGNPPEDFNHLKRYRNDTALARGFINVSIGPESDPYLFMSDSVLLSFQNLGDSIAIKEVRLDSRTENLRPSLDSSNFNISELKLGGAANAYIILNKTNQSHLLRSSDYGRNWQNLYTSNSDSLLSIRFDDSGNLFLATSTASILKSSNGGSTWSLLTQFNNTFISSMEFGGDSTVIVGTRSGGTYISLDDGQSWWFQNVATNHPISKIQIFNDSLSFIEDDQGNLFKYGGRITFLNEQIREEVKVSLYPNPSNGLVNLATELPIDMIRIYSSSGRLIKDTRVKNGQFELPQPQGLYFIEVIYQNESILQLKIVKAK